ncbi:MAG: isocitrate/isopropylmalate dehydrogenase family protein [Deltaproteobacteria bacterium]|nr:isocitrate/isopropylmalate dehydrogenase family protein [Deltaproteobacteria bacterium]
MATTHKIVLLPGDGIGPEITTATRRVLEATGLKFEFEEYLCGQAVAEQYGTLLPDHVVEALRRVGTGLKGPIGTLIGKGLPSANVALRKAGDLYANYRPCRNLPGIVTPFQDVDLIIIRENTEDLYSGLEHEVAPGVVESIKVITEKASTRIARFAFETARKLGRRKVTAIHKANIMKVSDGLFLDCFRNVAKDYPGLNAEEMLVDHACTDLVSSPQMFDVMVMENLFGDILSDLCAGLVGGLGVCPAGNIGEKAAVFEPVHGTAPDIAGQNKANPTAMILSAAMMLDHLGETAAAQRVRDAVSKTLSAGKIRTGDLGGSATTTQFTEAICAAL